jgi:hypothetical protein
LLACTAVGNETELALWPCSPQRNSFLALQRQKQQSLVQGFSTFYSPIFGLIGAGEADTASVRECARELARATPAVSEVRLAPMDPRGNSWAVLKEGFQAAGWLVGDYYCFGNWVHRSQPGGFEAYLAQRPGRLRSTLRRHQKKLMALDGFDLRIYSGNEAGFDGALAAFNLVYARSWKAPEPFPEFIPGLCRLAAKQGGLRLGIASIAGQPVAAQLWWVTSNWAHIVKLAYVPEYAQYSPGTVLSAAMFEHVIDVDRVAGIDYLIGDDVYKSDWMTERRERRGVVAFNVRQMSGLLAAGRHFIGQALR